AHENWARLRIEQGWSFGPERNDTLKLHPDLVPYEQLPESEKEYDRYTALETIKVLLAMGCAIQPLTNRSVSSAIAPDEQKLQQGSLEQILDPAEAIDLSKLIAAWNGHDPALWSKSAEPYRALGQRMLTVGEPLLAYDVLHEGLSHFPQDVRLRRQLA